MDSEASAKKLQSNYLVPFLREQEAELYEMTVRPSGGRIFANCKSIMVEFENNAKYQSRRKLRRPAGRKRTLDSWIVGTLNI